MLNFRVNFERVPTHPLTFGYRDTQPDRIPLISFEMPEHRPKVVEIAMRTLI